MEKLVLDTSSAIAELSAEKKRVADRDHELGTVRRELIESREISSHHHTDLERMRAEHETLNLALASAESEKLSARDEADRLQRELHKVRGNVPIGLIYVERAELWGHGP